VKTKFNALRTVVFGLITLFTVAFLAGTGNVYASEGITYELESSEDFADVESVDYALIAPLRSGVLLFPGGTILDIFVLASHAVPISEMRIEPGQTVEIRTAYFRDGHGPIRYWHGLPIDVIWFNVVPASVTPPGFGVPTQGVRITMFDTEHYDDVLRNPDHFPAFLLNRTLIPGSNPGIFFRPDSFFLNTANRTAVIQIRNLDPNNAVYVTGMFIFYVI